MANLSADKSRMSHQYFVLVFSNFKILKFLKTNKQTNTKTEIFFTISGPDPDV